jgi:hypothetical protein
MASSARLLSTHVRNLSRGAGYRNVGVHVDGSMRPDYRQSATSRHGEVPKNRGDMGAHAERLMLKVATGKQSDRRIKLQQLARILDWRYADPWQHTQLRGGPRPTARRSQQTLSRDPVRTRTHAALDLSANGRWT